VSGRVGPVFTYGAALFEPPQVLACGGSAVYKSWPVRTSRYISIETIALRAMIHAWAVRLFKEMWISKLLLVFLAGFKVVPASASRYLRRREILRPDNVLSSK
jgi:hypothetical protein